MKKITIPTIAKAIIIPTINIGVVSSSIVFCLILTDVFTASDNSNHGAKLEISMKYAPESSKFQENEYCPFEP